MDDKRSLEKDKECENCKLPGIVELVIKDFKTWRNEEDLAEGTYVSKFANILDILLEDEDVTVYDGETFSTATQSMQILDENEQTSGRRIDLIAKTKYNKVKIELCAIEYKIFNASNNIFIQQQSKNVRMNSCIFADRPLKTLLLYRSLHQQIKGQGRKKKNRFKRNSILFGDKYNLLSQM